MSVESDDFVQKPPYAVEMSTINEYPHPHPKTLTQINQISRLGHASCKMLGINKTFVMTAIKVRRGNIPSQTLERFLLIYCEVAIKTKLFS